MLERAEGVHQYKGMSVKRLGYLATLLDENTDWKLKPGTETFLSYGALIAVIVTQLGIITFGFVKLRMLALETQVLKRCVREHDLLLVVPSAGTRV